MIFFLCYEMLFLNFQVKKNLIYILIGKSLFEVHLNRTREYGRYFFEI